MSESLHFCNIQCIEHMIFLDKSKINFRGFNELIVEPSSDVLFGTQRQL